MEPTSDTRRSRRGWVGLLLVPTVLMASLPTLGGPGTVRAQGQDNEPAAEATVRVVHGASDAGPIDVYVDGAIAIVGVTFLSVSDAVLLSAGDHQLQVVPSGAAPDQAVAEATARLSAGQSYHVAALGALADLRAEIYAVDLGPLDPGLARLRVIQGSPDAGPIDVAATGGDILFPTVDYPDATDYAVLTAGIYDLELRAAGTDAPIVALPGTVLEAGVVYDVLAVGQVVDGTIQSVTVTETTETVEVVGRPAALRTGTCEDPGDTVAPLTSLTPPIGDPLGQAEAAPTESSFTAIPVALDAILADDHAISVARAEEEADRVIACGEIGGGLTENGALVVGLREANDSGFAGIAVLSASVVDPTATDVSIFIATDLVPVGGEVAADEPTAIAAPDEDEATPQAPESPRPEIRVPDATAEPTEVAGP